MDDPKTLVAATLLLDSDTVNELGLRGKVYLQKAKGLDDDEFQEYKRIAKELGCTWDREKRMWRLPPALRLRENLDNLYEYLEILEIIGINFVVEVNGSEVEVKFTASDLDEYISKLEDMLEELAERKDVICFKLKRLGKEEFKKLVREESISYEEGKFCYNSTFPLSKEAIEIISKNAVDAMSFVAIKKSYLIKSVEKSVVFLGNEVKLKVDPDEVRKFESYAEIFEECDIKSPDIERERREKGFSYCEYKWVNVDGEMQLQGVVRRLYKVDRENGIIIVPRGLYKRALTALEKEPEVLYNENIPEETSQEFLRDYQVEAVNSALKLLKLQGAATIQAATGAGKTEMAVAIVKELLERGVVKKVFFLSLNRTLNIQAVHRFRKYGIEAGLVDSENFDVNKSVVACTVQTLYKSLEKLRRVRSVGSEKVEEVIMDYVDLSADKAKELVKEYEEADMVVVDEVQHVPARTVSEVIRANPRTLRLGLSATPWRDDGKDVMIYALIGDIAERRIYSSELIEKGYLVPVEIYMWKRKLEVDDEMKAELRGLQGAQKYAKLKNYIFYNEERNKDIVDILKLVPKPALVLVKEIRHAYELNKMIKQASMSSMALTGKESSTQRESALRLVKEEKLDVLVATTLADEGLDLPPLRSLILAAGGRSQTRTLQRIGRITRPYEGKKVGIVVDIWDDDREVGGIFYRQGLTRQELYKLEPKWKVYKVNSLKELKRKLVSKGTKALSDLLSKE